MDGPVHRAWIFGCHNSAYFNDPLIFEVITERLSNLSNGTRCRILID